MKELGIMIMLLCMVYKLKVYENIGILGKNSINFGKIVN